MIVTREEVDAFAHCGQQINADGSLGFDSHGKPDGDEDECPGVTDEPVRAIKEVVSFLYGDFNGGSSDPFDAALAGNVSHSVERLEWLDRERDAPCPHCGMERVLSLQRQPNYGNIGGARGGRKQMFADRRARRKQTEAAQATATAAERQASALEQANALKQRELDLRERELSALEGSGQVKARRRSPTT